MTPKKTFPNYRISSYSFRGNYSFLNSTLCTVTFGCSTYRCGNYSREETIQGRKLYEEIRYADWFFSTNFEIYIQIVLVIKKKMHENQCKNLMNICPRILKSG